MGLPPPTPFWFKQCVSALSQHSVVLTISLSCMMFYWCFLFIVVSNQKTVGRNTQTVSKTWNIAADMVLSTCFWVSLFKTQANQQNRCLPGEPAEGYCLRQAHGLQSRVAFWCLGSELQPAPSPILKRRWGKPGFLLRCRLAAFYRMGAFSGSFILLRLLWWLRARGL